METNWDQWKFWFDLGQWGIMALMSVWMLIDRGRARNSQAIREICDHQDSLDRRVLSLENRAATHEDVAKLRAEIEGMKSTLTQVDQVTNRIYDYLLNKKGR